MAYEELVVLKIELVMDKRARLGRKKAYTELNELEQIVEINSVISKLIDVMVVGKRLPKKQRPLGLREFTVTTCMASNDPAEMVTTMEVGLA